MRERSPESAIQKEHVQMDKLELSGEGRSDRLPRLPQRLAVVTYPQDSLEMVVALRVTCTRLDAQGMWHR
jgi:hypothetical protein